jgi:flagellar hook-associated protein 3 FlgL
MRITEGMLSGRMLADLQRAKSAEANAAAQVSTGNRMQRPSDDPHGVMRAVRVRADLAAQSQYRKNVDDAVGWATATDSALSDINDVLQRVRELTVRGANDTTSQKDRADLATEIDQLIAQAKSSANASFNGQYIFAGEDNANPPYTPDGGDSFGGTAGSVVRTIGPGVSVALNPTGGAILGDGTDGKALQVLRDVAAHLRGGTAADSNALRTTDLKALDDTMAYINTARAESGALSNRLTAAANRLYDIEASTEKIRSDIEHVDLAEAISRLSNQSAVYQAALQATGSQLNQRSLMDFLG